jgi:hypothetical protein
MSSRLIALAEAVKDLLNDTTWSQVFTATRTAVPRYEAKGAGLEVAVRPFGTTYVGRLGRAKVERDYQIDIVIAQRVEIADNDATDELIDLAEEIAKWFEADDNGKWRVIQETPLPKAWCVGVESVASAYAWEFAIEDQFVAVRRLTVKCVE